MKGINTWSFNQYKPFCWYAGDIYINRVVPDSNSIHIEWSPIDAEEYFVFYRFKNHPEFKLAGTTTATEFDLENLGRHYEYEFYVAAGDKKSRVRLARTDEAIGTVVNYLHPEDKLYWHSGNNLCSPSIVRHPDGYLLCSMDIHGGNGAPQNLTLIFRSDDNGASWHYVSELMPCYWGKLFIHKGDLYMYATSTEYGDLMIGKSTDGGKSFGMPIIIGRGSGGKQGREGFHKNVENMVEYKGRIYLSVEWGSWFNKELFHAAGVISCDANADLMNPENWHIAEFLPYDPTWPGVANGHAGGTLEGSLAIGPDGNLYNIMRYSINPKAIPNKNLVLAYKVNADDPDAPLEYSHSIKFNGNDVKFVIQYDEIGKKYYSIVNYKPNDLPVGRTVIALVSSPDMENWSLNKILYDFSDCDQEKVGVQYVDFLIEGNDIIYVCRTALNNAENFHNSNYTTFHRIENFRDIKPVE